MGEGRLPVCHRTFVINARKPIGVNVKPAILIVEDETGHLDALIKVFAREGLPADGASTAEEGLRKATSRHYDLILTDLIMPGMGGIDLLRALRTVSPDTEVIVMSAFGTIEIAVEAMREGAYDFITKPIKRAQVLKAARRALEKQALLAENRSLRAQLAEVTMGHEIVGSSEALRRAQSLIRQSAPTEATVLLQGESGTGKELFARTLHNLSARSKGPFVAIDCASLPASIVESELFGYERGAFTGADRAKQGRIQATDGGTLFLDEVGELDPEIQAKLLRVLQEGEVTPLAATKPTQVDVRVVAATHRNLKESVELGEFREDLYYRLNVITVRIPNLRERKSDIPLLCQHFLARFNKKNSKSIKGFTQEALQAFGAYDWPGNVRQLANVVERAVVLSHDDLVDVDDLAEDIAESKPTARSVSIPLWTPL